jgi:DNA ligase-1
LTFPAAKPAVIRALAEARVDAALLAWSYDYVGDLAETVALIWPTPPSPAPGPELSEVVEALTSAGRLQSQTLIPAWLDALGATERWALLKLITGAPRVGVSARLAKQAAADLGGVPVADVEEIWHAQAPPYVDLFAWLAGGAAKPLTRAPGRFRPVMLAQALDEARDFALYRPEDYAAEWKWDGIRVQAVNEGGVRRLYSRTGDLISDAFPDLLEALTFEGVIDGELLVLRDGKAAPFSDLQQRLNRKSTPAALLASHPAGLRAYDILVDGDEDVRSLTFRERRRRLERLISKGAGDRVDLSPLVAFSSWDSLAALRVNPPPGDAALAEGLMLKRWESPYLAGRPKGPWFKWKRDPFLVDAVLLYAQRGHGRRSSYYSDFTFGVWRADPDGGRSLTPVGKAYFGFTDEELKALDAFVRDNTLARFGPVRQVRAEPDHGLVLEVAFEGLKRSTRHKSGVAMRFPRIHRIRWDKPPREADDLSALEARLGSD